ncbi:probable disease resistance protein RPP1 [Punica granatum]|uniref:Probable disease resistance protein RPP1 n=1 Tax=Punica granatum TaxID=22663 RepID=A0A6P8BWP0_PUNGR|nr:probable disease resistance protein RPP1 [Punica granatum]
MADDVQLNTKPYGDAPEDHAKQLGSEEVQQWEDAPKKVAKIKGSYAEFAKDFAGKFSMKLKVKQKYVIGSLARRSDQQDALMNLLDAGSSRDVREKLKKKKVLIVLDNVYNLERVGKLAGVASWFGDGSRIIITSWSKSVPAFQGRRVEILEAELMKFKESLILFIIGSQLQRHHHHGRWNRIIDTIDKIPSEKAKDRLRISYDSLNWEAKKIFLDIACFFINEEKMKPIYMWQTWGIVADLTVEELIDRSLVNIIDKSKFWMHDQLKDLGRSIVREATLKDPRKPSSRIWMPEDALKVLQDEKFLRILAGKENVNMLRLSSKILEFLGTDQGCLLTKKEPKSFKNLRFLSLQKSKFSGDLQDVLPKLTWLSWHYCPTRSWGNNLCLKNLVVLDLSESDIRDNWTGWRQIGMYKELKFLDLRGCYNLTRTPGLSECTRLERLILRNCISLSIRGLVKLEFLSLHFCKKIEKLPDSIGHLTWLTELDISWSAVVELPGTVGSPNELKVINMKGSATMKLPSSLQSPKKLEMLDAEHCYRLQEIPQAVEELGVKVLKHILRTSHSFLWLTSA